MTSPLFVRPLTEGEKQTLNDWLTSTDEEQIRRAQVILKSAMGQTAIEIGQELGFHPDNLKKWLRRFNQQGLSGIEVLKRGPKNRFTDEQIQAIKDIYHRSPREFGLTYDSWTPQKLTVFVIQRGIVSQISHVTVRQILNDESLTDHSNNSIIDEPVSLPKGEIDTTPKVLPVIPYKKNDLETLAVAETFNDYASRTELTKTDPTMTELLSDGLQALLLSDGLQALRHNNSKAAIDIFKALLTRAGLSLEIQAQARCYLSQAYEDARNYPEALTVIEIYEDATLRSQLSARLLAKVKLRLGWGYSRLANYAKAIARFNDARTIFIELDDQDGLGAVYYALGYVYIEINESNLARGYLLKALDNLKFTKDLQLLAKVYINIGLVSYQEGDFEGAKLSYLKAEQYAEGISDASLLGLI